MIKYIVDSIFVNIDIYIVIYIVDIVRGTCLIQTRCRLDFDRHCNVDDVKKEEEDTQCSPMCPATVGQHHDVENVDDVNRI